MRQERSLRPFFLLFLVLIANGAFAQTFVFHMRGDQEVPPVLSVATGGCMGQLNQGAGQFTLTCVHDVTGATVMHIHRGAAGVNGPILFDLGDPATPVTATWSGMTPADIADMLAGDLYLNIHTDGRPAGEIRGQILSRTVDTVPFTADGGQSLPPNPTSATASCTADLDAAAVQLSVSCTHDLPAPTSAEIHEAPVLQSGPSVFTFGSPASPLAGAIPMTPRLVADYAATFLYLQISSGSGSEDTASPQIRGQIGTPPAGASTGTIRIIKQTSPSGGTGFSFTEDVTVTGNFTLDDGQTQTFASVAAGTYSISESNPSSTPGNYTVGDVSCDDEDSETNFATRTATIQVSAGEVVTCTFRNILTSPTDSLFVFHLSGDQEVPPIPTQERGGCMGRFQSGPSTLTVICTHNVIEATVMHFHRGAPGVNGPIVFDLGSPVSPVIATWSGMSPVDVADLFAGNFYLNIHTGGRPAGAIRGQVLSRTVDLVNFTANSGQTVPPGSSAFTATCSADLDTPATSLAVQCTHSLPAPDEAHIHQGAFGANGPQVFAFASAASPFSENVPMTPRWVADFAASLLYLDIHTGTSEEEAQEIRGQIGAVPVAITTGTIQIVKSTTPAGATGFGFTDNVPGSSGTFTLNDGGTQTFTNVPAGSYTVTENNPASSGFTLTDVTCSDGNGDSVGNPFARTATINVQGGEVVTCTFRNLQTIPSGSIFVFHLSGDQEAPPVSTTARGGCMAELDAPGSRLSIVCTHNVDDPSVMHIHRGIPGVNGPIVFDLGNPISPVQAVWTGITPSDIADLQAGNLYVNVHSGGRPAGEIRGQLLSRTVDSFAFGATGDQEVPPTPSFARGRCEADLSTDATSLFVECDHSVANATTHHLHDAPPGVDGPLVFTFPPGDPFSGDVPMTPRLVADFAAGFLYVNTHSTDFTEGEIRGQLIPGSALAGIPIPTLAQWLALLFACGLLALGWWRLR